jgi:hypothetical protein
MRAFLWVPPNCSHLRGLVIGNNNMLEQGILENSEFRKNLSKLGFAEIFFSNIFDAWFDVNDGAVPKFNAMLGSLADVSGYDELATVPVVPIGHSACASFPWNFGAALPERTLAMLSIHGDSPQTNLPGSGRPNWNWGSRNVDGIPGLLDMGEYEWWEARLDPTVTYRKAHPQSTIALRCDAGNGHFNTPKALIDYLSMFIRKSAATRLPSTGGQLKPLDPKDFWLEDRWHVDLPPNAPAAPFTQYRGNRADAYFTFDAESARATEKEYAQQRGKLPQLVGFLENGAFVPQTETHEQLHLSMAPEKDGVTFEVHTGFYAAVPSGNKNPPAWAHLPVGAPIGHSDSPTHVDAILGPVVKLSSDRFRLSLNRINIDISKGVDVWFAGTHPGDEKYKSVVQQAVMHVPPGKSGDVQTIDFKELHDIKVGEEPPKLDAISSAGLPVRFYVLDGPAELKGDRLKITAIPPRAKFPVKVTVVAWQWGRGTPNAVQTAVPVTRSFVIQR